MRTVLLVDDHPVVRKGVATVLDADPDIEVVGEVGSVEAALKAVKRLKPEVVMTDVQLPGSDGIELCQTLHVEQPKIRTIVLTRFPNESVMLRAFAAGAKGFLVKECDPELLCQTVKIVLDGGAFVDPHATSKLITLATKGRRAKGPFGLTLQQMRVLELLPRGLSNREIAGELGLKEETVKSHLSAAMRRLGAKDRTEAAAIAVKEGLG